MFNSLKIDYENQIENLKTQNQELKNDNDSKKEQLDEYQSTADQTNELIRRVCLIKHELKGGVGGFKGNRLRNTYYKKC